MATLPPPPAPFTDQERADFRDGLARLEAGELLTTDEAAGLSDLCHRVRHENDWIRYLFGRLLAGDIDGITDDHLGWLGGAVLRLVDDAWVAELEERLS